MRNLLTFLTAMILCAMAGVARSQSLNIINREPLDKFTFTPDESSWIREHAGIIFFGDGPQPNYSMDELIDLSHTLGVKKIKTWLKGESRGEMAKLLDTAVYQRILAEFDTVLFDVCPDYLPPGGPYDETKRALVRSEYESVAYYLASKCLNPNKTFLLSLFMETNLFFSLEGTRWQTWPADQFFNDATDGVKAGIARAKAENSTRLYPRIFTVIEVGGFPKDYINQYLPKTHADLYALSYYGRGELGQPDCSMTDTIGVISKAVPHDGPFGQNNLILGELGRSVFAGGHVGEDREQIEYLRTTLNEARANQFQYAFVFWLTDQERSWDDGWGYVSSKRTGGKLRRAWHAFQGVYRGRMSAGRGSDQQVAIEAIRPIDANPRLGQQARLEVDVANRSSLAVAADQADGIKLTVSTGSASASSTFSLAPDELATLQAQVPAPLSGVVSFSLTTPDSVTKTTTASLNRADLVVDRIYTDPPTPKRGDRVRFFAVVRNLGNTPITDVAVHFHIDDFKALWYTWGCFYGTQLLGKGQTYNITGNPWTVKGGKHTVRAWANPDGARESNYNNNIAYQEFDFGPEESAVKNFGGYE